MKEYCMYVVVDIETGYVLANGEKYKDFGGIRLEDDILITPDGSRFTGEKRIPIKVEDVEEIMKN